MTTRVRDFTLMELERMTGAGSRTLHMSVYRGHLKAITIKHRLVVRYKEAKEFVWRYLTAKLAPTPRQVISSLVAMVKPVAARPDYVRPARTLRLLAPIRKRRRHWFRNHCHLPIRDFVNIEVGKQH